MNKPTPVSLRLDPELNERISAIALSLDRPKSWVIEQATKDYVALDDWRRSAVEEGLKAADEGRVVAHEDVQAWVKSWDQTDESPQPKCD
jgi:predicted transcriptional regulator